MLPVEFHTAPSPKFDRQACPDARIRWRRLRPEASSGVDAMGRPCPAKLLNRRKTAMEKDMLQARWAPLLLSVLRIVAALIFIEHGTQKFFGFPAEPQGGYPAMLSLLWWQGAIELAGGLLLLAGLWTRLAAFILSGDMAVAYWMVHAPKSPYPALNGGDAAILYCFVFLYIVAAGGGVLSLDRARRGN
jgi:putative oxidoreductase